MQLSRILSLSFLFAAFACSKAPSQGYPAAPTLNTPGYSWADGPTSVSSGRLPTAQPKAAKSSPPQASSKDAITARPLTPEPTAASPLVQDECLAQLKKEGVHFEPLAQLRGVETPIELSDGKIGGIVYWVHGGEKMRLDCRLALALSEIAPILKRHRVEKIRFSGAYVYRTTRSGRLSHHAHGLALDVHEIRMAGHDYSVKKDFARNQGCPGKDELNRLACELQNSRLFEEFLTPDYNSDHYDHVHLSVPRKLER